MTISFYMKECRENLYSFFVSPCNKPSLFTWILSRGANIFFRADFCPNRVRLPYQQREENFTLLCQTAHSNLYGIECKNICEFSVKYSAFLHFQWLQLVKGQDNSQQEKMRRILRKEYPFPMLAAKEASGKWVLICCACSLLKTRKGRERNGKETRNGTQ